MLRMTIFDKIHDERVRQHEKWGSVDHGWGSGDCSSLTMNPEVKLTVLAEEFGEVARAVLEHDGVGLESELVQVAAVCVAWLEAIATSRGKL